MKNFTVNLQEKIENSKLKIIEIHEKLEKEVQKNLAKSSENLISKIKSTNSKSIRDMQLAEQELLKKIKSYKNRSKEELMKEKKKNLKLFIAILATQILILAVTISAIFLFLEYQKQKQKWMIPKENRSEVNGQRFIVIQKDDLKITADGKVYYIVLKKGE